MTSEMQRMVIDVWEQRFDVEVLPLLNRYCLLRRQLRAAQRRAEARRELYVRLKNKSQRKSQRSKGYSFAVEFSDDPHAPERDKRYQEHLDAWAHVEDLSSEVSDLYHELNDAWDTWVSTNPFRVE